MTRPLAHDDRDVGSPRARTDADVDRAQRDADDRTAVPPPSDAHVDRDSDRSRRSVSILRGVRAAFAFFSRIPVGGFPYDDRELAWAPAHAPLVGGLLGAALGALDTCLLPIGAFPSATLVIGVSMLLTGALHEDGLADTSDALGGGHDAGRVFAILKDSRIGAYGAAAIAVSIFSRAALLGQLAHDGMWALPLAWCAARVGPVWLMVFLPYVTPTREAKSDRIVRADWRQALVASAWFLAAMAGAVDQGLLDAPRAGVVAIAIAAVAALTGFRYYRRVGGITGDFLGATEQLGEIAVLAVLAWPR
jgi:adenosylcobinamide-GDP ribazoletransferase